MGFGGGGRGTPTQIIQQSPVPKREPLPTPEPTPFQPPWGLFDPEDLSKLGIREYEAGKWRQSTGNDLSRFEVEARVSKLRKDEAGPAPGTPEWDAMIQEQVGSLDPPRTKRPKGFTTSRRRQTVLTAGGPRGELVPEEYVKTTVLGGRREGSGRS